MRTASRSGQSILEYTLILGVVVAAIVAVLFTGIGGGSIKESVEGAYSKTGTALKSTVDDLGMGVFQEE